MKNKILIVDDNMVNRGILKKMLMDQFDVEEAENGAEALKIIKKEYHDISAIILDLIMPVMDGKELLGILSSKQKYSNIPILIATGEGDNEKERECLQLGAWDFVTKPYNPLILKLRLNNIIARSQTHLMHQVQMLAQRDSLTDVYNRQYFMKKTAKLLLKNPEEQFVLVRLDIDQFRLYNTSFGSEAGDKLLKDIAQGIDRTLKEKKIQLYTYGRIESDVFCMCIPYHKELLEENLLRAESAIQALHTDYRLKATFGLYVIENHNEDIEKIYANSVEASRYCKSNVNEIFAYYGNNMGEQEQKAQRFSNEMKKAMEEKQFKVFLQPKYSIMTDEPCGAEALVRWIHPMWGKVSPGEFIPVFERNGLIIQLDYYMWENACMLLKKWKDEGRELSPISINISRVSMYNPLIVDQLVALTDQYQVDRQYLNLEITESAYMSNPDLMRDIISGFRKNGFVIMMDDFGSGYSSLNTLKDMEVDILKVDMKFLPTGHNNTKSEKILASVIRMAGWLDMPVVVEGVETLEQKEFLESIGCNYIQGYFYAKPMPVEEYEKLLDEKKKPTLKKSNETEKYLKEYDAIWSSDSNTAALLKSVSIPYAIFEYADSKIDFLRTNQSYQNEFKLISLNKYLFTQEYYRLLTVIDEVVLTRKNKECECLFIMSDGISKWYQVRLSLIGTIEKTSLISATFTDITTEKRLENELNIVFNSFKEKHQEQSSLLVVDDTEVGRAILSNLFEDEYHIIEAADGREALDLLEKNYNDISAILLDMIMPGMGGQEFLGYKNKLKEAADIPVIVISAEDNPRVQISMLKNGVNDYITKPFVPAVVKKRLANVVEYNDRFRKLVVEFKEQNGFHRTEKNDINLSEYSKEDVRQIISFLEEIFDLVRLVDPKETSVITILPDGTVDRKPYSCFSVWGKEVRCENCSSMCAMNGHCTANKFELLKKDVFYVVSQPVTLNLESNQLENVVLEVASKVTKEETYAEIEKSDFKFLDSMHAKAYIDPLTNAYNRRYMDEMVFLHHGQNQISREIVMILFDIYKFKQINDLYGHQTGDRVLQEAAEIIKKQIRKSDSLIRFGGDEFVIILPGCTQSRIEERIQRFQEALTDVKYGTNQGSYIEADFGASYTDNFESEKEFLDEMLKEADEKMYQMKKMHGKAEG